MLVSRDPFAREEIHRSLVRTNGVCDWCGQRRKTEKLWQYQIGPDSINGRSNVLKGLFCSASCFRNFHS
jgi:hypothetical protein